MNCLFAKAGEEITGDDGKVWGRFTCDVHIVNPLDVTDVIRADGTRPTYSELLEPELVQFLNRRRRELGR
jgi:hypothetical protein